MNAAKLLDEALRLEAAFAGLSVARLPRAKSKTVRGYVRFLMATTWALHTPGSVDYHRIMVMLRETAAFLEELHQRYPKKAIAASAVGCRMPLREH